MKVWLLLCRARHCGAQGRQLALPHVVRYHRGTVLQGRLRRCGRHRGDALRHVRERVQVRAASCVRSVPCSACGCAQAHAHLGAVAHPCVAPRRRDRRSDPISSRTSSLRCSRSACSRASTATASRAGVRPCTSCRAQSAAPCPILCVSSRCSPVRPVQLCFPPCAPRKPRSSALMRGSDGRFAAACACACAQDSGRST